MRKIFFPIICWPFYHQTFELFLLVMNYLHHYHLLISFLKIWIVVVHLLFRYFDLHFLVLDFSCNFEIFLVNEKLIGEIYFDLMKYFFCGHQIYFDLMKYFFCGHQIYFDLMKYFFCGQQIFFLLGERD